MDSQNSDVEGSIAAAHLSIEEIVDRLDAHYGTPQRPDPDDALGMILWENVAYLASDSERRKAFDLLRESVGLRAEEILSAPHEALLAVARHGIVPEHRVERLRRIAEIVVDDFDGNLDATLKLPIAKARRAIKRFPSIGDPGADKILLFTRTAAIPAWESNGLRVLLRNGYGTESADYSASYRSAQSAVAAAAPAALLSDFDWLVRAHQLLRQHGQELCRRNSPHCSECPLSDGCPTGRARVGRGQMRTASTEHADD